MVGPVRTAPGPGARTGPGGAPTAAPGARPGAPPKPAARRKRGPRAHLKGREKTVFTRQLSTMISAGIALVEALEILREQAKDPGFRWTMDDIIENIRSGADFSTSLAAHPKVFSEIYVNMVKAGEASGQLDIILTRLSEYMEAMDELKREIIAAMIYPVVSLVIITSITAGLVIFIIPKFEEVFNSMEVTLPAITRFLLALSAFIRGFWYILIPVTIAVFVGFRMFTTKVEVGIRFWHAFLLKAPVFGTLYHKVVVSRFSRTFSTLVQSGVPIVGALDIVAETAGNVHVRDAIKASREAVTRGEPLAGPLEKTHVFPLMVTRMIDIGERTGALEQLLAKISDFYDQEVRAAVKGLTSIIEPLLIVTMGVIVGTILMAVLMPIMKLQQVAGG